MAWSTFGSNIFTQFNIIIMVVVVIICNITNRLNMAEYILRLEYRPDNWPEDEAFTSRIVITPEMIKWLKSPEDILHIYLEKLIDDFQTEGLL